MQGSGRPASLRSANELPILRPVAERHSDMDAHCFVVVLRRRVESLQPARSSVRVEAVGTAARLFTRRRPFDAKAFIVNAPERATDGVVAGTEEHHEQ
jgi:hypothetical protein